MKPVSLPEFDWEAFARRCLKPDPARLGTWTARRWGRPAALRITRIVAPCGWTANSATAAACCAAVAACVFFGVGGRWCMLAGVALLHLWYLLDHVDGQLARLRGTASLDGTAWDYLMHHAVQLFVPQSLGFGLFRDTGSTAWLLLGTAWGWGTLMLGLRNDVRYKAFFQRLKRVHGELRVVGGGAERPRPGGLPQPTLRRTFAWLVLKSYETHVMLLALTVFVVGRCACGDVGDLVYLAYFAAMALPAPLVAALHVVRMVRKGQTERDFAAWFRVADGATLEFRDGWWYVEVPESERGNGGFERVAVEIPLGAGSADACGTS